MTEDPTAGSSPPGKVKVKTAISTRWAGMTRTAKRLTVAAVVVVFALILATAAYALIQARAEVTGSVGTGTAELNFQRGNGQPGLIDGEWIEYTAGVPSGVDVNLPAGVTATATAETDGTLTLNVDGLFPGEGCAFGMQLQNGSSLDLTNLAFDYNGGGIVGPDGDATADIEMWFATSAVTTPAKAFPATVAAGDYVFEPSNPYTILVVELSPNAIADGSAISVSGVAVVGEATGGR
jgi:hypothetical protein